MYLLVHLIFFTGIGLFYLAYNTYITTEDFLALSYTFSTIILVFIRLKIVLEVKNRREDMRLDSFYLKYFFAISYRKYIHKKVEIYGTCHIIYTGGDAKEFQRWGERMKL